MKKSLQLIAGITFAVLVSSFALAANSQAEERYYEPLRLNQYYPNDNLHQPMSSTAFVTFGGSYHSHFGNGASYGGGHGYSNLGGGHGYSNAASLWSGYCGQKRHCGLKGHFGWKKGGAGNCGCGSAPVCEGNSGCDDCQSCGSGGNHGCSTGCNPCGNRRFTSYGWSCYQGCNFRLGSSHFFGRHHRGLHGRRGCGSGGSCCDQGNVYENSYDTINESPTPAPATEAPAPLPPQPEGATQSLPFNGATSITSSAI